MFTPKVGTGYPTSASGRALASGSRGRTSIGGLTGSPYGGVGARATAGSRSPYVTMSGRNTPSNTSVGGSAAGSQSVCAVEACGAPLPALVKEALTFADKSSEMSAVLSACGWAWLVSGRRLLVWRNWNRDESVGAATQPNSTTGTPLSWSGRGCAARPEFRELLLPQSDLAHRAQLVVLRQRDPGQMPCCLAVSPEGAVRFWPSIAHETTYTEVTAELQGQECDSLVYLSSALGYFLATTTSTTLLLQPSHAPHQHGPVGIAVRQVKVPGGLLGGLSRKVTSLMFGSLPTQAPEARLVRVVCRTSTPSTSISVLVLSAEYLQCWQLAPGQPDVLLYQAPVLQHCQQALTAKLQSNSLLPGLSSPADGLPKTGAVWLLDMQPQSHQPQILTLLLAAVQPPRQDLILALATLDSSTCPNFITDLTILQHTETLHQPYYSTIGVGGGPLTSASTTADASTSSVSTLGSGGSGDASAPPAPLHQYRLLLCNNTAYIYTNTTVMSVSCSDASLALPTRLPVPAGGERVLGAARGAGGRPLFFCSGQGVVTVAGAGGENHQEYSDDASTSGTAMETTLHLESFSTTAAGVVNASVAQRLQASFMYYNKEDFAMAQQILDEIFPDGDYDELPRACLTLSRNILDDRPATDPRWAEVGGGGLAVGGSGGSVSQLSLIITNQIRDKTTAHKYYVSYLQQTGLWPHLAATAAPPTSIKGRTHKDVLECEQCPCVRTALLEHAQRLAFASALRSKHQQHQLLVDQAIGEVVKSRREAVSGRLTAADLFYCRLSRVEDAVWGLLQAIHEILAADVMPRDAPASIHTTATLLLTLLKAATAVTNASDPGSSSSASAATGGTTTCGREYVPWTASEGPKGVRTLLCALHKAIVETGLPRSEDAPTRAKLYAALVDLTDFILTGYQPQLASLLPPGTTAGGTGARFDPPSFASPGTASVGATMSWGAGPSHAFSTLSHERYQHILQQYQRDRYSLIHPLVEGEQYSQALSLGEKYCDFRTLVEVCETTKDTARLDRYMHQFVAQGFSDFVFRYHLETGKRGRLLSYGGGRSGTADWSNELSRFLKGYSGLEWVHQLGTRDFAAAHTTLLQQGMQETTYLARKKTLLSLSKLCKIADEQKEESDDAEVPSVDPILLEEDLILYQEQLPEEVLAAHNLETDTMRVLTPVEMIQLYTGSENELATELDFKKALDLLAFVPDLDEAEDLKKTIWVRAVLRDPWRNLDTDTPLEAVSDTMFFKTIDLAFTQGCNLQELLVPVEELLSSGELQPLCQDSAFSFLINAGYEKIEQLMT